MVTRSERRHKKKWYQNWYKKWWVWLIFCIIIIVLINLASSPKESLFVDLENDTATLNKKSEAKFNFKTNPGNKYSVTDLSNNQNMGTNIADSGSETLTMYDAGKYKLTVYLNDQKESKTILVKKKMPANDAKPNNTKPSNTKSNNTKPSNTVMSFGNSDMVGNGGMVADVKVNSVERVDPDNDMVTDISHNYDGMQQYIIVNYSVSSIRGTIPLDDFDGSELSVADSNGTIGTQSSNRDNGVPEELSEGQNADLRIGVGLKHSGNEVTVKFNNLTWKGQIQ